MFQIFHALKLPVKKAEKSRDFSFLEHQKSGTKLVITHYIVLYSHYRGNAVLFQIFYALILAVKKAGKSRDFRFLEREKSGSKSLII